jgi:Peptidase family M23
MKPLSSFYGHFGGMDRVTTVERNDRSQSLLRYSTERQVRSGLLDMTAIRIHILPAPLFIESICRNEVCMERVMVHVLLRNLTSDSVEIRLLEIAFINSETGSALIHRFVGKSLEMIFTRSAAMVPDSNASGTTIVAGKMAGITNYSLEVDGDQHFNTINCSVTGYREDGTAVHQSETATLHRDLPETKLTLPLKGRWWVAAGHLPFEPHRRGNLLSATYAYDFVQIGAECRSYRDSGTKNGDYYAYGAGVFAAADGVVVRVSQGYQENIPGQMLSDADMPAAGNHIALQHGPAEFTLYAHLQPVLAAKAGDHVGRGQILGWVGNSGQSTEPHLHFHFANGPEMNATGLPVLFHNWKEDAFCIQPRPLEHGILLSGEIIEA